MPTDMLDRKPTSDSNIDVVLAHQDGRYVTALYLNDCSRLYGLQQFNTIEEAERSFNERGVAET